MNEEVENSGWAPDSGHSLITVRKDLEGRLNRKVKQVKQLDSEKDAERIRNMSIEIVTLLYQVFKVVGKGVSGGCDDTFLTLSRTALDSYDLSAGVPFSYYFRYKYSRQKKDKVRKNDQMNHDASSWEGTLEYLGYEPAPREAYDEWEDDVLVANPIDDASRSELINWENRAVEAEFARFLALVVGFLDHVVDKRDYTQEKKLYTRLFFTESITRLVKMQVDIADCEPFESNEQEIFSAIELRFQDSYMSAVCRTIKKIWLTKLKEGFGSISPDAYGWRLKSSFIRQYFAEVTGKMVSDAAISQQRANYKKLIQQYGMSGDAF